jgi:hypothetical protein
MRVAGSQTRCVTSVGPRPLQPGPDQPSAQHGGARVRFFHREVLARNKSDITATSLSHA